eukprot:5136763-Pyramimonas_sp.AAC.1
MAHRLLNRASTQRMLSCVSSGLIANSPTRARRTGSRSASRGWSHRRRRTASSPTQSSLVAMAALSFEVGGSIGGGGDLQGRSFSASAILGH